MKMEWTDRDKAQAKKMGWQLWRSCTCHGYSILTVDAGTMSDVDAIMFVVANSFRSKLCEKAVFLCCMEVAK